MRDDFPGDDPKTIWQNQPTETSTMTLETNSTEGAGASRKDAQAVAGDSGRAACRRLLLRFRRKAVPIAATGAAPAVRVRARLEPGRTVFSESGNVVRGDAGRCGLQHRSGVLPARDRAAARLSSSRPAVVVWAGDSGNRHVCSGTGVGCRQRNFSERIPFMTLVVVWIFAYFVIRMREQRGLQREIDELNKIETENNW